jgi:hypothetical protein
MPDPDLPSGWNTVEPVYGFTFLCLKFFWVLKRVEEDTIASRCACGSRHYRQRLLTGVSKRQVLPAQGGRVRFFSSDGRYLAHSENNSAPELLALPEDQPVTDATERFDWEIARGAFLNSIIQKQPLPNSLPVLVSTDVHLSHSATDR